MTNATPNKRSLNLVFALALLAGAACAETVVVTDTARIMMNAPGATFSPSTVHATTATLPNVATPLFHFDCMQTNGWTFADGRVTRVPSLVGDRSLSVTGESGYWPNRYAIVGPEYVLDDDLGGRPVLDFGERKSKCGLLFSPDPTTICTTTSVGSNVLQHIGTVFFVYGSQNGGGWLMSGGYGDNLALNHHDAAGYHWHRGMSRTERVNTDENINFNDPVMRSPAYTPSLRGVLRQDGWPTAPEQVGFSGGWQVLSFMPTNELAQATGLGLNDARWYSRSGGLKIGEFIAYDRHLTDLERDQVEAYLHAKWFDRAPRGLGGNARLGVLRMNNNALNGTTTSGVQVVVSAAPGETLTIERLRGGRVANAALTVKGGGALALGDATFYNGTVRLAGGTLKLAAKPVPTVPPERALVHLDASVADSFTTVTEGGTNFVRRWDNLVDRTWYGNKLALVRPYFTTPSSKVPFIRPDALGAGKPVVDFGKPGSEAFFLFATNETTSSVIAGVATVVAFVGAHGGGGQLVGGDGAGNYIDRVADQPTTYTVGLLRAQTRTNMHPTLNATNGVVYLDGARHEAALGYLHPGYQVVAFRVPGTSISRLGDGNNWGSGGLRLGEILIYDRVLTDEEFADAQAYLMRKWMNRTAPGYAQPAGEETPDVQKVRVCAASRIEVPAGQTALVGTLTLEAPLVKTGGGTLAVETGVSLEQFLQIEEGDVEIVGTPTVTTDCQLAANPSIHVDASQSNTFETVLRNGTNFVTRWYAPDYASFAFNYLAGHEPWILTNATDLCNGKPVVDFGPMGSAGATLNFSRPLDSIRSIFIVWGQQTNSCGGFFLGSSDWYTSLYGASYDRYDFHRGTDSTNGFSNASPLFYNNTEVGHVTAGEIYVNGMTKTRAYVPTADYQLVEVHTCGGAHASGFARDRTFKTRYGGQRIAEALIYERVLSPRERLATRNYLMKKWFGTEPETLPAVTVETADRLGALVVEGTNAVEATGALSARAVLGEGVLAKTGAGTLTVGDLSGFTGTVQVAAGTLVVTGSTVRADAALVTDGIVYHADAAVGVTTVTNDVGEIRVSEWKSRHDASWSVVPGKSGTSGMPTYLPEGLNGQPAVDMVYGSKGANGYQFLRFRHDGAYAHVGDIRSVFWVIGSQNGGGYLLGGGTNQYASTAHYNFHRGLRTTVDSADDTASCTNFLLGGASHVDVREAAWRMNGRSVWPTSTPLSGGWDLLSMVVKNDAKYADAEGFAFDGRTVDNGTSYLNRSGGQRLAELVIYNRRLSDDERGRMEGYLARRWALGFTHAAETNAAEIELAAGTTLDLSGTTQYVASVTGVGTVRNGTLAVGTLVADAAATAWPTFAAPLALGAAQTVELRNVPEGVKQLWIPICTCTSCTGALSDAVFTGDAVHPGYGCHLRLRDGMLGVEISGLGTMVILR